MILKYNITNKFEYKFKKELNKIRKKNKLEYNYKKELKKFINSKRNKLEYNYKLENIYLYLNNTSLGWNYKISIKNRRTSTYKYKIQLKNREIRGDRELNYIIFRGGFGISLDYCKQIIYKGYIKVNGKTIKNPKYKIKKGFIIKKGLEKNEKGAHLILSGLGVYLFQIGVNLIHSVWILIWSDLSKFRAN